MGDLGASTIGYAGVGDRGVYLGHSGAVVFVVFGAQSVGTSTRMFSKVSWNAHLFLGQAGCPAKGCSVGAGGCSYRGHLPPAVPLGSGVRQGRAPSEADFPALPLVLFFRDDPLVAQSFQLWEENGLLGRAR